MLHKALEQFLTDVYWDEPDYLVVDLPPGTGDIALSLAQFLPRAELYVVTTPQPAAQRVAQRAAFMAEKVKIEVKGVIENMSWFTGDDGRRYEIFGAGGGQELAERIDVPLLGRIPLVPALREGGDAGRPIVVTEPGLRGGRGVPCHRRRDRRCPRPDPSVQRRPQAPRLIGLDAVGRTSPKSELTIRRGINRLRLPSPSVRSAARQRSPSTWTCASA